MTPRDERGSATAWAVPFIGVLALLTVMLAGVGGALVTVRRVQSAADLSALAGATALAAGGAACAEVARVAARNDTSLDSCAVLEGGDVQVVVSTSVRLPWPEPLHVRGRARAGPAG